MKNKSTLKPSGELGSPRPPELGGGKVGWKLRSTPLGYLVLPPPCLKSSGVFVVQHAPHSTAVSGARTGSGPPPPRSCGTDAAARPESPAEGALPRGTRRGVTSRRGRSCFKERSRLPIGRCPHSPPCCPSRRAHGSLLSFTPTSLPLCLPVPPSRTHLASPVFHHQAHALCPAPQSEGSAETPNLPLNRSHLPGSRSGPLSVCLWIGLQITGDRKQGEDDGASSVSPWYLLSGLAARNS